VTPPHWLHATVLRAGPADLVTQGDTNRMLARAQAELARTVPVTLQRVYYHPEAIALVMSPASALAPVLAAARADGERDEWTPPTLCYGTVQQPAAPVIAEFGKTLSACEVTIREMSLVVQDGPEDLWN
jgi:hypothetical protein